jgi:hypothetical protein
VLSARNAEHPEERRQENRDKTSPGRNACGLYPRDGKKAVTISGQQERMLCATRIGGANLSSQRRTGEADLGDGDLHARWFGDSGRWDRPGRVSPQAWLPISGVSSQPEPLRSARRVRGNRVRFRGSDGHRKRRGPTICVSIVW